MTNVQLDNHKSCPARCCKIKYCVDETHLSYGQLTKRVKLVESEMTKLTEITKQLAEILEHLLNSEHETKRAIRKEQRIRLRARNANKAKTIAGLIKGTDSIVEQQQQQSTLTDEIGDRDKQESQTAADGNFVAHSFDVDLFSFLGDSEPLSTNNSQTEFQNDPTQSVNITQLSSDLMEFVNTEISSADPVKFVNMEISSADPVKFVNTEISSADPVGFTKSEILITMNRRNNTNSSIDKPRKTIKKHRKLKKISTSLVKRVLLKNSLLCSEKIMANINHSDVNEIVKLLSH